MSLRRIVKQTFYAGGCLFFLAVLISVIITVVVHPRSTPPPTAPAVSYQDIQVENVSVVEHNGLSDIVARLRNPNPQAGVGRLPLTFTILDDQGNQLATKTTDTYILPASLQYAAVFNIPTNKRIATVNVSLPPEIPFIKLPSSLPMPTFNAFLRDRSLKQVGRNSYQEQTGQITNTGSFDFLRVEVTVIALDNQDNIIGAGQTFLGQLNSGQQRDFVVQWPARNVEIARVIVQPSTNIFLEENITKIIGDPSLLR
ncbi:MAG: FxLYD domain-containing protein [Candidatus Andersenbacteria bacterium]|nr:FxLYD domain-containing protein [Candidatus Andersenbacteria bacterium]